MNLGTIQSINIITPEHGIVNIRDSKTGEIMGVPCNYVEVIRAFNQVYHGFIGEKKLNHEVIIGQRIYWHERNMMFAGFVPEVMADNDVINSYKRGNA